MKKPKYEALADSLLRKINRGIYSGDKLPSMSAIAKEYAVNLQTANRAVKFLEQQGIVSCFAGKKGTVINAMRATLSEVGKSGSSSFMVDQVFSSPVRNRLRFLHNYFNDNMQSCFKECAQLFTQRYPWTEIEIIQIDTLKRIENDEIPYDTVLLNGRDVSSFARRGRFFKLKDYPELARICEEEFVPGIWKNCHWDNELYAVPFSWSVPLAAGRGRRSVFSWQDPVIAQSHPGSFNIGFYSLICLFLGEPFQFDLLPEKKQAFHELLTFIRKLCMSPEGKFLFWDNPAALRSFDAKKNCFICGYYSNINTIIGKEKDWHYSVLPSCPRGVNIMVSECLAVNARTGLLPESLLWLKFLQSREAQQVFMKQPCFLPIRRSMTAQLPEELVKSLEEASLNAVHPRLSSEGLYRLYSAVYPLLSRCFSGELDEETTVQLIIELLHEEIVLDNLKF
ncbi:MAG: GntR family transcriptional regulator [Lentisphaeria bacterium]|nr:GntR family transcriptional regulator [Lentisphaeria bacterium]